MSRSRKRRIARTNDNILRVKEKINDENYRVKQAKARAALIEIIVIKTHCHQCKGEASHIHSILVWDKTTINCTDPWLFRLDVKSTEQFRLFSHLPIRRIVRDNYVPTCPSCVEKLLETRAWKNE